jgi:hypothetical protein
MKDIPQESKILRQSFYLQSITLLCPKQVSLVVLIGDFRCPPPISLSGRHHTTLVRVLDFYYVTTTKAEAGRSLVSCGHVMKSLHSNVIVDLTKRCSAHS